MGILNPILWIWAIGLLLTCLVIAVVIAGLISLAVVVPVVGIPILAIVRYLVNKRKAGEDPSSTQAVAIAVVVAYLAVFLFGFLTGFLTVFLTGLLLLGCCLLLWLWDVPLAL